MEVNVGDKHSSLLLEAINYERKSFMIQALENVCQYLRVLPGSALGSGIVFTTLHFIRIVWMGPIS
jgi:hypothetical protein